MYKLFLFQVRPPFPFILVTAIIIPLYHKLYYIQKFFVIFSMKKENINSFIV